MDIEVFILTRPPIPYFTLKDYKIPIRKIPYDRETLFMVYFESEIKNFQGAKS